MYENLPLSFESGGYISRKYSGRVVIKLTNYSVNSVKLNSGTPGGYIVYSLLLVYNGPTSNANYCTLLCQTHNPPHPQLDPCHKIRQLVVSTLRKD